MLPTETVCTIAIPPLCATVQAGQNGHLDDGQEGMTRFVLCKKKKTVVVLLDNMKNSSSSTVITVSRNCPRAPDDCSMKAGVEPEIPRCSCLPHIRTVQNLIKISRYRRWWLGNFVPKTKWPKYVESWNKLQNLRLTFLIKFLDYFSQKGWWYRGASIYEAMYNFQ